jgi:sugar/nucleoside kinase (ribokinase family)
MAESRVKGGVQELARLDDVVPVIFSANRAETLYLAEAVLEDSGDGLPGVASALREALDVTYVISHAEHLSVLATPERVYTCAPPRVDDPELTTGVGDCFNAGYLYARLLGLSRGGSLTLANLAANWFLRRGTPPEPAPLSAFVDAERSAWV